VHHENHDEGVIACWHHPSADRIRLCRMCMLQQWMLWKWMLRLNQLQHKKINSNNQTEGWNSPFGLLFGVLILPCQ
jgi:hypothetical protein